MNQSRITFSVVVPVYNEADNVAPLAGEIMAALADRSDYEIIFVDDGSDDGTGARLDTLAQEHARFRALHHRDNCGQSAGIWSGVGHARGAWIVTLDGDGQNDPADIPALLARAFGGGGPPPGLAMVAGVRAKRADNWVRRLSSRVANRIRSRLLRDDTPDTGCGLKVFRRDAFLALPFFDHMHRFLPALIQRGGGQVVHVEVSHRPRQTGESKYGLGIRSRLWAGILDLLGVMWLQRRAVWPEVTEAGSDGPGPAAAMDRGDAENKDEA
ncbi:MAG: glycosyltransferase family 2 protein [Alphaproteobacteria bacterium]|nr:glycosyltransferase family 2 protein [Alphaproteobacteria bacterium]